MKKISFIILGILLIGCETRQAEEIELSANDYHNTVDRITDIMVHDIFSPPVASRIYAYTNIAALEVINSGEKNLPALTPQLNAYKPIPKADTMANINFKIAALVAQMEIGKAFIFSEEKLVNYRDSLYNIWEEKNKESFKTSKTYGEKVAEHIKAWSSKDNYKETRTMPKYSVYTDDPSRWQPTPPSYMDGIEPHWSKIRPFMMDSASQFKPEEHPEFSMEENTVFYKELKEVYEVRQELNELGNESDEIKSARFWDCNPYVSTQRGHLMFATKKITPGGHWMGICKIASKKSNLDFEKTVYAYTATSVAIADGFISCWDEKYRSELIRPETLINQHIDENWKPILQTPPFPEYPSGHSVVSGAAATVLTQLFGDNFEYEDNTEVKYGLPSRNFTSFNQAAEEAAISRMFGGIHYRAAIENGLVQGRDLGSFIVKNFELTPVASR